MTDRLAGAHIMVVGDVMLDDYLHGTVTRVSPEAAVPLMALTDRTSGPGGAANVASGIVALGGSAAVVGVVGDDEEGVRLRSLLKAGGVATDGVLVAACRPTTTKLRVLASGQHLVRVDHESCDEIDSILARQLREWVTTYVGDFDVLVVSDYAKGVVSASTCAALIEAATTQGVPVVVDPKGLDWEKYRGAAVIKPNLREAELVADTRGTDVVVLAEHLAERLPGTSILITRGADGMLLRRADGAVVNISVEPRAVFDVTGAGDTVVAALATALAKGFELEEAARLANRAAAIAVTRPGAIAVTLDDLANDHT